jgi:hypothetical protein
MRPGAHPLTMRSAFLPLAFGRLAVAGRAWLALALAAPGRFKAAARFRWSARTSPGAEPPSPVQ